MDIKAFFYSLITGSAAAAAFKWLTSRRRLAKEEATAKVDSAIRLGQSAFDISMQLQENLREDFQRLRKQNNDMAGLLDMLIVENKKLLEENVKLKGAPDGTE